MQVTANYQTLTQTPALLPQYIYMTKTIIFSPLSDVYNVLLTAPQLLTVTELLSVTQIATSHTTHLSTGSLTLDLPTPLPSNQINDRESTSGLNTAVIAGTVTGCALFGLVVAFAFLSFFCMACTRRQFCCKTVRVDTAAGECLHVSFTHAHRFCCSMFILCFVPTVSTQGVTMHINLQRPALQETRYSVPPRPNSRGHISFMNNLAKYGGGLMSYNSNVRVEGDGRFINNSALYGGGIAIGHGCDLTLIDINHFAENWAHRGGAIIVVQNSTLSSKGQISFSSNLADDGGGLVSVNSNVRVEEDGTFKNNSAD